ncbi:MAG: hypothetical protein V3V99_05925 [candidate division Zixibacteria bacterium]
MRFYILFIASISIFFIIPAICVSQNITIDNNLTFGTVIPGIPKIIDKTNAGSASEFQVSGVAGNEITIDFSLPTYMNSGSNNIQLVFSETDCSIDTSAVPDQSSPIFDDLDPWHTLTYRLGANGMTIWLGGMAIPGLVQPAGSYSGVIVLTVAYTGS